MPQAADPLEVSPYLMAPCRNLRYACMALMRHDKHRPRCAECSLIALCRKSAGDQPIAAGSGAEPASPSRSWPTAPVAGTRSSIEWRFVTGSAMWRPSTLDILRILYRRASIEPNLTRTGDRRPIRSETAAEGKSNIAAQH